MTTLARVDEGLTAQARRRYDRIAPVYDAVESMLELAARSWRRDLWARAHEGRVLELGVGTGKSMPFYPADREVVAMDISERMLERARRRATRMGALVRLELGDVQRLRYPSGSFDVVVATFLFCSVPDPRLGLSEALRILKPGGQLLLLEHVVSERPLVRWAMRRLDPISFHLWGAHIDRDTVRTVRDAGFVEVADENLLGDMVKRIEARAPLTPLEREPAVARGA